MLQEAVEVEVEVEEGQSTALLRVVGLEENLADLKGGYNLFFFVVCVLYPLD